MINSPPLSFLFLNKLSLPPLIADEAPSALPACSNTIAINNIDTIINTKVKSKSVMLLNKENKGLKFSYPKFKTLAIWTPFNDAPFVCLEPWIGYNDHHDTKGYFKDKDDVVTLKPNETFTAEFMIEIIK